MTEKLPGKSLVDAMVIKQDVGGPYPVYKRATLFLWSDGTVTWNTEEGVWWDE